MSRTTMTVGFANLSARLSGYLGANTCEYLSWASGSLQAGHNQNTHVRSPLALSVDLSVIMLMVSIRI